MRLRDIMLRPPQLIGLDIGTTAVKAVRIRRKASRVTVTALAHAEIYSSDSKDEPVPARDVTIAWAISQCLSQISRQNASVACGLSGQAVTVHAFDFPSLSPRELDSAVELEAAQVCPFDIGASAVAYHVISRETPSRWSRSSKPPRTVGIFAAAEKDAIRRLQRLCKTAQARCALVDVEGLALLNCLDACGALGDREMAMVLNVGSSRSNLAILSADGRPFVRDIGYAFEGIVSHLCEKTGAQRKAVLGALGGTDASQISVEDLRPGLHEACSILADRVIETVRYHGTKQGSPPPDKTFLCGGLALMKPVMETLSSLLPMRVELWNPLTVLPCARRVRKSGMMEQGSAFALALGLATRSRRDV